MEGKLLTRSQISDNISNTDKFEKDESASSLGKYRIKATLEFDVPLASGENDEFSLNGIQNCSAGNFRCSFKTTTRKHNMISTNEAAQYLVDLFKNTKNADGKGYACSTIKLGKLLTLAAFLYACVQDNISQLLYEDIISLECGATINNIDFYILDYLGEVEELHYIDPQQIGEVSCELGEPYERLLRFVFENFGAYPPRKLGMYINNYKVEGTGVYDKIEINSVLVNKLRSYDEGFPKDNLKAFKNYIDSYRTLKHGNRAAEEVN